MPSSAPRVDGDRLGRRLDELGAIGAIEGTIGCSRLALTDDDRAGRDLVVTWMRELGLDVRIDGIGNVTAQTHHAPGEAPVMTGSHIDTVATGGRYDGNLGVLAGLEVIETVLAADLDLPRPLAVGFFTDEEGARFPPDMLGSLVFVGAMPLEAALEIESTDGAIVGAELDRIGYRGASPVPGGRVQWAVRVYEPCRHDRSDQHRAGQRFGG
jgi:N-carbamoyl-L-amino-acid hydrolase